MVSVLKHNRSIRTRLLIFFVETVAVSLVMALVSVGFYSTSRSDYEENTEKMLLLNTFYTDLEQMNQDVYAYTLGGDEQIYQEIDQGCTQIRGTLKELSGLEVSLRFYRDIRDLEQLFSNYVESISRIYDHSYLCEQMTIGSKQIINKYYDGTQNLYNMIQMEFKNLYDQLLTHISQVKLLLFKKHTVYLGNLLTVILVVLVYMSRQIRSISYRVLRPVQALTENAREIEQKELGMNQCVVQEPDADSEMQVLIEVYNSMIQRIQAQIRTIQENASMAQRLKDREMENLRISNLLRTSELRALQMQINPHFLFNTLNMISQTAYMENAEQTMELLGKTASLLRYTLDHADKSVTLSRELEMLGNYVELQECRFGERIRFSFDLDERFHQLQVPSMILQPLVENALSHGVGMKTSGAEVRIRTAYEEELQRGVIEISDNGDGMTEETLEQVRREMRKGEQVEQKIGLGNVYRRLQLVFDGQADMELFSMPGAGTRVCISLPCAAIVKEETGGEGN